MTTEIDKLKKVEFYAASVGAWYNTSLERDKSILTLSSGGIGLLITLLATVGVASLGVLCLYIAALLFLAVSLCAVLCILGHNASYIERVVLGNSEPSSLLGWLDKAAMASFALGAVCTAFVGTSAAVNSYEKEKEKTMASGKQTIAQDSFNGDSNLQKSFNGVGNLAPQAQLTTPVATGVVTVPASPSSASATSSTVPTAK